MYDLMITYALVIGLALPLGIHIARSLEGNSSFLDRVFSPIEAAIYRLSGVNPEVSLTWQAYAIAALKLHAGLIVLTWLVFMFQGYLPLNPDGIAGMRWDTALHTAVSFATNTNQQHYSGQAELSHLSQTFAIVTLQFLTPATGMAVLAAVVRTLSLGQAAERR
ncbi:K+-transporting ATPase ATPase A chain [Onishia taeanensis]|uniref:K+-transporting ATPase ATPase A chain n=1 Tax=Onishia taeanensis TaxID=284577 RepID=A0A328XMG6_9GAMM|nr:potassium-transporting ATPase subunit KdpA [Halomonas taeanensis]RAR59513.1 K+-transporting ATPase ATPase A chain [Halomonas taeanensis]